MASALIVKKIIKWTLLIMLGMLLYIIISSTIPTLAKVEVSEEAKAEFAQQIYYGTDESGPDRAVLIETPEDAFEIRIELIKNAAHTLDISTHNIVDSSSTRAILYEIYCAAERGVEVRVIIDAKKCNLSGELGKIVSALDRHENITFVYYNPLNVLAPWDLHNFLHDKFFIADDNLLLLGGRNIDERHFAPAGYSRAITHDRDVLIWRAVADSADNPSAVAQTKEYMELLCSSHYSELKPGSMSEKKAESYYAKLADAAESFVSDNPRLYDKPLESFLDSSVETKRVTLVYNPVDTIKKEPWIAYQLRELCAAAEESVVVQSPYFTLSKGLLEAVALAGDNAQVTFFTNSMASSPNLPAFSNYYFQREKFLDLGVQIFELQSGDSNHGKSLIIDDRLSAVGSFNMDSRSAYFSTETMLLIDSEEFAAELSAAIDNQIANSLEVGADNKYIPSDTVEKASVPLWKSILMHVVYILLRPFQYLL